MEKVCVAVLVGVSLSVAIAACSEEHHNAGGSASPGSEKGDVELGLFPTLSPAAYEKIIPEFTAKWKQEHNQNITFNQSYGGSGSQTVL